ncbi:MAG: hypothetical protein A2173_06560 [Planctomycetes bacterium RBG_13_44_8b]|nr:MAG: hypothetical protein A2173_06560 [Planctomycetes bacterium RBG_13_44_8b]
MIIKKHLSYIVLLALTALAFGKYSGGTGEPNDPYLIATPNDLNDIGNHIEDYNKFFIMVADINLIGYNETNFNIIGNRSEPFTGVFDGKGHTISNFNFIHSDSFTGIFGYIDDPNAEIKNLGLVDPNVSWVHYVGSLAGELNQGTITDCYVQGGRVLGGGSVGGLVGSNRYGTISNCYSTSDVSGGSELGGLAGSNSSMISNCYSTGNVLGDHWHIGGLVGDNLFGSIFKCYSLGSVSGESRVGGLVGENSGSIDRCYSKAEVSGSNIQIGGLVGLHRSGGTISNSYSTGSTFGGEEVGGFVGNDAHCMISNCYSTGRVSGTVFVGGFAGSSGYSPDFHEKCFWDSDVNPDVNGIGDSNDPNVIGLPTAQMQMRSTSADAGWDMVNIWDIGENQTYPFLRTCLPSDIDKNGITNFLDMAILAENWLKEQ